MKRLPILLLLAAALAAPSTASAACTSSSPLPPDKRLANETCDGVHPGTRLVVPSMKYGDYECDASFAFRDRAGERYLTIPGTCFLDFDCLEDTVKDVLPPPLNEAVPDLPVCVVMSESELEPVYRNGPIVRDTTGTRVGRIAYAVNKDGVNLALVRVDKGVRLDPAVPFYGGPVGLGTPGAPEETYVYSSPNGMPGTPNARVGVLHGNADAAEVTTEGLLSMASGASVMRPDGSAMGYCTGGLLITGGFTTQPLGAAIARAERRTRLRLTLMTAPLRG